MPPADERSLRSFHPRPSGHAKGRKARFPLDWGELVVERAQLGLSQSVCPCQSDLVGRVDLAERPRPEHSRLFGALLKDGQRSPGFCSGARAFSERCAADCSTLRYVLLVTGTAVQ